MKRGGLLITVLLLASCREHGVARDPASLQVSPLSLAFPDTWTGTQAELGLTLTNTSRAPLTVQASTTSPFAVEAALELPGGATRTLPIHFRSEQVGPFTAVLSLSSEAGPLDVPLSAAAIARPECPPTSDCLLARFDEAAGRCVNDPAPDGQACGAGDLCLTSATCLAGTCRGVAVNCDDGNRCTLDTCRSDSGCHHEDVGTACPGDANHCHAAACDPASGCQVVDVADGVSCGENDCTTAHVCMAGQCAKRPAPEGSECAAATACQGASSCVASVCTPAPASEPKVLWRHAPMHDAPDLGSPLYFQGQLDDSGNAYLFEFGDACFRHSAATHKMGTADPCSNARQQPMLERQLVSLAPDGTERFRVEVRPGCLRCLAGFAVEEHGSRVFVTGTDFVQARSTLDGALLWEQTILAGIPINNTQPDGGASFWVESPILLGNGNLGVPVTEGYEDHHSYLRVLSRDTGAPQWDLHRKGHFYGMGASGSGELWTSSSNCWAPLGQLERLGPDGGVQAGQFEPLQPLAYGERDAVGRVTSSWAMALVDDALHQRPITVSPQMIARSALRLPRRALTFGTDPVDSMSRGFLVDLDPATATPRWRAELMGMPGAEHLLALASGEVLVMDVPDRKLAAVAADGGVSLRCELPANVSSPLALIKDRLVLQVGHEVVAFSLPGAVLAPSGWVATQGGPGRGRAPR